GGSTQYPHEMGIDEQDNVYLTMQHGNQMEFTDATLDPNDFDGRLILVKYSPSGERLFTTDVAYGNVSSSGDIRNESVTIHTRPNGTTFLTGLYGSNSSSFIVFGHQDTLPMPNNSNDGARQFLTSFDKDGNYIDVGVLVDEYIGAPSFFWENTAMVSNPAGDFYLTGKFAGQLRLGMDSLLSPGTGSANGQSFAVKFDPEGILDLSTTSIDDKFVSTSIKLYPNPANKFLNIELAEMPRDAPFQLRIFTLNGQLLLQQDFWGDHHQLSIDDLSPGLYLLDLQAGGKRVSRKFIVE
ncbi:MAG: T9SS type A sorting domain-containing protein, partial [Bacteroidota bacterium]